MNDLEILCGMLRKIGVEPEVKALDAELRDMGGVQCIEVTVDDTVRQVTGYIGFTTVFSFTAEGELTGMGIWE